MLHQNMVHKICRAYCPQAQDRQDLFQEIALQLWRAFPNFKGASRESTWIYRIALNVAITHLRSKKSPVEQLSESFLQTTVAEISEQPDEQIEALYQAIYTLSDLEKALVLLFFEEKSMDEITAITGISAGNVRVKMHRIREKLRSKMQPVTS